jgi:8-oxo-dGTP pyrophosphatase MutT (NUDIX family)
MERQFTATVYILDNKKVLLIHHKKLQKWLPPGGHMDPNETPPEAAIREAKEETGLDVKLTLQENVWITRWNANSFARPYLCLLEEIPAFGNTPAHQHIDFIYVAEPTGGALTHNSKETKDIRWFTLEEIESLQSDHEIFEETKQTLKKLMHNG